MEKVINRLFEIEEKANRILENTNKQKNTLYTQLNDDLDKLNQDINKDTDSKLNILRADMNKEIDQEHRALIDDCDKQLSHLEDSYLKNHDSLVDTLFHKIVQL